jgi:NTE family protein
MALTRRQFLAVLVASAAAAACAPRERAPRIGLALGAGGARGLAHITVMETLDQLGIRPHRITGSSMGAVMGALYASGLHGRQIRALLDRLTVRENESWTEAFANKDIFKWIDFIDPDLGRGGLVSGESFIRFLLENIKANHFEDLQIRLEVVAADLWSGEQQVFTRGALEPALQASIAIPGLFAPVEYQGRVYVDGGIVNPVPYDLLFDECDFVIAVDVSGRKTREDGEPPSYLETIFSSVNVMQSAIMREKLKVRRPDIYLQPDITNIRVLEFYKAEEILRQTDPLRHELMRRLGKAGIV